MSSAPPPRVVNGDPAAPAPRWIFGYGSLMWRPGFAPVQARPAVLEGWHRAFCRYSWRHRGTPEQPGLVMGLRAGGACRGMGLEVAPAHLPAVLADLDAREGAGYERHALPLRVEHPAGPRTERTWVYLPNQQHPSYFGELPRPRLLHLLRTGRGENGTSLDYLRSLLEGMEQLGLREPDWEALLAEAEALPPEGLPTAMAAASVE